MSRLSLIVAVAPFLVLATASGAGVTLVYELEKQSAPADPKMPRRMALYTKVRLAFDGIKGAKIDVSADDRINIVLPDDDPKLIERTKRSVARPGHVEFRILADNQVAEHAKAIELAKRQSGEKAAKRVLDSNEKLIAKWVAIAPSASAPNSKTVVSRQDKSGNEEKLVLIDEFNVTGEYISSAQTIYGDSGWTVTFSLNDEGAKRFGELTGSNLPDPATGIGRELGIVIDDELVSAAIIRSKITSKGEITGHFTEAETLGLAGVLNEEAVLKSAPPLPKLKLISESKIDKP
jgi:preprotein translocase subunit SecD